jgi:hypothetical protein
VEQLGCKAVDSEDMLDRFIPQYGMCWVSQSHMYSMDIGSDGFGQNIIREMINGIDPHDVDTEGIVEPRIVASCGISVECTTAKTSSAV